MTRINLKCVSCDQNLELTVDNDQQFDQMVRKCTEYFHHLIPTTCSPSSSSWVGNEKILDIGDDEGGGSPLLPFCDKCRPVIHNLLQLHQELNRIQREIVKVASSLAMNVIVNNNNNDDHHEESAKLDSPHLQIEDSVKSLRSIIFNKFCPDIKLTDCRPSRGPKVQRKMNDQQVKMREEEQVKIKEEEEVDDDVIEVGPSRFNFTEDVDNSLNEPVANPLISALTKLASQKRLASPMTKSGTPKTLRFKRNFRGGLNCCLCNHEEYEQSKIIQHILTVHHATRPQTNNGSATSIIMMDSSVGGRAGKPRSKNDGKFKVSQGPDGMLRCDYCGYLLKEPGDMMKHIHRHIARDEAHQRKIASTSNFKGIQNFNEPPKDDDMDSFLNSILS